MLLWHGAHPLPLCTPKTTTAYTEAMVLRKLLGVALVSMLVPAALSAQATATMKVSATVVAPQTVAPQASAAELAESVAEQMQNGEQVTPQALELMDVEEPGVVVSLGLVEQTDVTTPPQVLQVTVAYSGN